MKHKFIIIIIPVLAVAGGIIYSRIKSRSDSSSLATAKAEYGYINKSVTATGTVEPVDTITVGAQISGMVIKLYADFNSEVKKGQLLAEVDPSVTAAQVQEAKATLATAQSSLQYQKSTYERQNELYQLGAISKADYQLALNQYTSAQAAVSNAAGMVRIAEKNLSYTKIYSPVDGTVLDRNVSVGQTIAASLNAPVLFIIAKDLTKMQVNAGVDEADIGNITAGQRVTFTVDAFPDSLFRGTVKEIYLHPAVSANVVTYTTLIDVDNHDSKLKPGMTASINIYEEEDSEALLIPSKSISYRPDASIEKKYTVIYANTALPPGHNNQVTTSIPGGHTNMIWLLKGDTLLQKMIITGINDDTHVRVLKGVSPGDIVVTGIAGNNNKKENASAPQSPFMPKMQRPSGGGGRR